MKICESVLGFYESSERFQKYSFPKTAKDFHRTINCVVCLVLRLLLFKRLKLHILCTLKYNNNSGLFAGE